MEKDQKTMEGARLGRETRMLEAHQIGGSSYLATAASNVGWKRENDEERDVGGGRLLLGNNDRSDVKASSRGTRDHPIFEQLALDSILSH